MNENMAVFTTNNVENANRWSRIFFNNNLLYKLEISYDECKDRPIFTFYVPELKSKEDYNNLKRD